MNFEQVHSGFSHEKGRLSVEKLLKPAFVIYMSKSGCA